MPGTLIPGRKKVILIAESLYQWPFKVLYFNYFHQSYQNLYYTITGVAQSGFACTNLFGSWFMLPGPFLSLDTQAMFP